MVDRLSNWPLLQVPDEQGQLHFPGLEESVKQSIKIILRTRPGEQLMRPGFGAGLVSYLHEQNTLLTRRRIQDLVTQSLTRWEKRIFLDRVDVWEVPESPSTVKIDIAYRLKRSNMPRQLGVTMELEA